MCFSTLFIKEPRDWATITNAVKALTRNRASDVRYVGDVENLSDEKSIVDVVVMQLTGDADYALEIYWKGMMELADDAVGMYLANALGAAVIISDDNPSPCTWLRLSPNGIIENIDLDIEKLDEHSIVKYKIA
jgi:hypothetical protein